MCEHRRRKNRGIRLFHLLNVDAAGLLLGGGEDVSPGLVPFEF